MRKLATLLVFAFAFEGVAAAGPTARFGLTFGHDRDDTAPVAGPAIALGERLGPFVGELEWAYLSFLDTLTSGGGVQRVGLTLRADLGRSYAAQCKLDGTGFFACTRATSFYGEIGAGERFGQWMETGTPTPHAWKQPEAHLGLGLELDNQLVPTRTGWQLGLRFTIAHDDPATGVACRGTSPACMGPAYSGLDYSVLVEWMYFLGH
jgi:hypothetical protein